MKKKTFLILAGLMLLASCRTVQPAGKTNPVYVTNTKKIYILPTACIEAPVDCMQLVSGKFGDQTFTLMGLLVADENEVSLSLFNDFGTDMGTLFYDGFTAGFDSPVFPPELKAEYLINDLQCAYYKPEALTENFAKSGLTFTVEKNDSEEVRKIFSGKKLISEITRMDGSAKIVNHLRGYQYELVDAEE